MKACRVQECYCGVLFPFRRNVSEEALGRNWEEQSKAKVRLKYSWHQQEPRGQKWNQEEGQVYFLFSLWIQKRIRNTKFPFCLKWMPPFDQFHWASVDLQLLLKLYLWALECCRMSFLQLSVDNFNNECLFSTAWNCFVLSLVSQTGIVSVSVGQGRGTLTGAHALTLASMSTSRLHAEVILITDSAVQRSLD